MELIKKKVFELIPYINNSRTHSEEQITQIASSIKEFGFTNPILIDKDNSIIAGHGRLQAVKRLGFEEVPCIIISGLSKTQIKALIIADNQLALNAGWDIEKLSVEIEGLEEDKFDLNILGFEDDFIKDLLIKENLGLTDEDNAPEIPDVIKTKQKDIWLLGNHRIMCGDSVNYEDVYKLMNNKIADLVNTDPPYGVNYQSNMRTKSEKFNIIKNDDVILNITPTIDKFSKGWVFIWTTWKVIDKWLDNTKSFGFPTNMVVWHKGGGGIGDLKKTFSTDYEMALVFNRGAELCGKRIGSVWKLKKDKSTEYKHPTQKPVELSVEAIDKTTNPKSIVMDLFLGSGSTLIACEKIDRKCYGMELDPKYCDVIIQRWQQFTGKEAIHEQSGKTYNSI
jgi:DNA modification methylase